MIDKMKALVRQKGICVLATASRGRPHCSLMSYLADPECREIYMVTFQKTQKYRNLQENPWVSVLIDNREESPPAQTGRKKALTITGRFEKMDRGKKESIRKKFLKKHPHMKEMAGNPDAEVICIRVHSFQLLEGLHDAYFAKAK